MKWQTKAVIQRLIALLPSSLSYPTYYWFQRKLGGLRRVTPIKHFRKVLAARDRIERLERSIPDSTILEVGTGYNLNSAIAFWLLGADRIKTIDLNPYLKEELIRESIEYLRMHTEEIEELFGNQIHDDRLSRLLQLTDGSWSVDDLMELCKVGYVAPGDAASVEMASDSIDFHVSFNVFEHIPRETLVAILREGNRLMRPGGLFVHRIDYSDHFSSTDPSISQINFLQFSDTQWRRIAGNRFGYTNRLRVDDFCDLFRTAGHELLLVESMKDSSVLEILHGDNDFQLADRFREKSDEVLATVGSWILTEKRH